MTNDIDIYRSAKSLIDSNGIDGAIKYAEQQHKLLKARGYSEGASTWLRVLEAIDELTNANSENKTFQ